MPDKKQDKIKFGESEHASRQDIRHGSGEGAGPMNCDACEAVLTDALDGLLNPAEQAAFDQHLGVCAGCTQIVADARRGMAWLEILKENPPEPPNDIVQKILAQTSSLPAMALGSHPGTLAGNMLTHEVVVGQHSPAIDVARADAGVFPPHGYGRIVPMPFWSKVNLVAIKHTLMQPRLALTAAMAFFSITLTLNLAGVRLADIKVADLKPSSLRRQLYEANSHVVRNLDNLRVVYEVEARVRDLRRVSEADEPGTPAETAPPPKSKPSAPEAKPNKEKQTGPDGKTGDGGTSRRESTKHDSGSGMRMADAPQAEAPGAGNPPKGEPNIKQAPAAPHRFQPGEVVDTGFSLKQYSQCHENVRLTEQKQICSAVKDRTAVAQGLFSKSGIMERKMA